jgi:acetyltransferase-like isoleucine patch superfamily enzyme
VWLEKLKGSVEIRGAIRPAMIRIGFGQVRIFDRERSRSIWSVEGLAVFGGEVILGHGVRIAIDRTGSVVFGDGLYVSAETAIASRKGVSIGSDVLISWDVLIIDSDWHSLRDASGVRLNPDQDVEIGDHVWIGARSTLLKGARIPDGAVVAAGSVITGAFTTPNTLLAGVPAREIRSGIRWSRGLV